MKIVFGTIALFLAATSSALAMDASELATFASRYRSSSNAPVVFQRYDAGCRANIPVALVQTRNLGNGRVAGITSEYACWGATFTYFEMTRGNLNSIRAFAAVNAGRSTGYSNWGPANPMERMSASEMQAIAEAINATGY
ncbi:MAG TPA: hypothetical protein V6D10_17585 [Trichocoleus sp.]|jgi:hypothetical protein